MKPLLLAFTFTVQAFEFTGKVVTVLEASIFHFGEYTVGEVKERLVKADIPVRMV